MTVLSEEKIFSYLSRVLDLSNNALERLGDRGTAAVEPDLHQRYQSLLGDLDQDRDQDSYLGDDSWNWIWDRKDDLNTIQLYGRLAWINLQLLELL